MKWSHQIENVIDVNLNILYSDGRNPLLTEQIDFWNQRQSNLENIFTQLRSIEIHTIAVILEIIQSNYFDIFKVMFKNLVTAFHETLDITLYLNPFRREVEKFEMTEFCDAKPLIQPMLHVICLIWANSDFFSTNEYISNLFRMLNNSMINEATKYLNPSSLFQGEIIDIIKNMTTTIEILEYYRLQFQYYREKLKDFYKFGTKRSFWTFRETPTFDRFDAFVLRLKDFLEIFNVANEFSKLEKIEIGGRIGKSTKRKLMKVCLHYPCYVFIYFLLQFHIFHFNFPWKIFRKIE